MLGLRGVTEVVPGYSGGHIDNPTYEQVCGKRTGHAEVVRVTFDPEIIPQRILLEVFFTVHDPTQLNRQGNDIGPHYRSCVFYSNEEQRMDVEHVIEYVQQNYVDDIVTEVSPLGKFGLQKITIMTTLQIIHKIRIVKQWFHRKSLRLGPSTPICMSEAALVTQNYEDSLSPEPWAFHLLGLITPILAISGSILGVVENQAYVAMGVVFVWGVAPILDIVMGESKVARPPRESGTPFEVLLWVHGILQIVVVATFFVFAANEGMTWWLVVGALSSGLSASASAIVTAHELGHKKRGVRDGDSPEYCYFLSTTLTLPTSTIMFITSG